MKNLLVLLLVFSLVACSSKPSQGDIETAIAKTEYAKPKESNVQPVTNTSIPKPTDTLAVTDTLKPLDTSTPKPPTNTPKPSNTPAPTNTPRPTNTPKPTNTPLPPTETPEPIILTGKGDSIVDANNTIGPAIVHIVGNSPGRHFSVVNYSTNGDYLDLLVNTSDPYEGYRPLDFDPDEHTARFEVKATGDWKIEILPLSVARVFEAPGSIEGAGDEVIGVSNSMMSLIKITGNKVSRHFSIINYGNNNEYIDLLVNTSEPYEGIRPLDFNKDEHTTWFVINSEGEWKIEVLPLTTAREVNVPGKIEGKGDEVIKLAGSTPDTAVVSGNTDSHHFSIISYSNSGEYIDLLVNTSDPYQGTVLLTSDTIYLVINSESNWVIEVKGK